jgi:hypothetical protein
MECPEGAKDCSQGSIHRHDADELTPGKIPHNLLQVCGESATDGGFAANLQSDGQDARLRAGEPKK